MEYTLSGQNKQLVEPTINSKAAVQPASLQAPANVQPPGMEGSETTELQQMHEVEVARLSEQVSELQEQLIILQQSKLPRQPSAPVQDAKLGNNYADAKRWALIQKSSLARFNALTLDERLLAQGQGPASQSELEEAPKYFSKSSDAVAANRLAKSNPAKYARLRMIAKEAGIFGK